MLHRTLIPSAPVRDQAATLCAALAGPAGAGMFQRPLYSDSDQASHYLSTGLIAPEFADALPLTSVDEEGTVTTRPADYDALIAMADAVGITITQQELEAILSQCDVSDQPWQVAVARLGLSVDPVYEDVT